MASEITKKFGFIYNDDIPYCESVFKKSISQNTHQPKCELEMGDKIIGRYGDKSVVPTNKLMYFDDVLYPPKRKSCIKDIFVHEDDGVETYDPFKSGSRLFIIKQPKLFIGVKKFIGVKEPVSIYDYIHNMSYKPYESNHKVTILDIGITCPSHYIYDVPKVSLNDIVTDRYKSAYSIE